VSTLVGEDGIFLKSYKELALRFFSKKINLDQVYLEFSNQIRKIQDAGLNITHLDSHEHVHMLPGLPDMVTKLAKDFKIEYVRLPQEPASVMLKGFTLKDLLRRLSLAIFTLNAKKRLRGKGIFTNDAFLGHFHAGRIDCDTFCYMLEGLNDGVSEFAFHPAATSEDFLEKFPWYKNAGKEYDLLLSKDWGKYLTEAGVQLATHKEALKKR
jgi:predicted glycoside hydrolase/deacetylase ChbG (UPF0249 family)